MKESTGELSSVMRVGSACMRVMDIHVYGVDLVSINFQSTFAHNTQAPPRLHGVGGQQFQLMVTFGVSVG